MMVLWTDVENNGALGCGRTEEGEGGVRVMPKA